MTFAIPDYNIMKNGEVFYNAEGHLFDLYYSLICFEKTFLISVKYPSWKYYEL